MKKVRNVKEITESDLIKINNCLVKFDSYLQNVAKQPTNENIALYEHWIDCMGDIEDLTLQR